MWRIAGIAEHGHAREASHHVLQKFYPLASKRIARRHSEACEISVRAREARREPIRDRVDGQRENDGDRGSRTLAGFRRRGSVDQRIQPIVGARRVALLDDYVLAFDIAHRA
jgi:hypothetical protein